MWRVRLRRMPFNGQGLESNGRVWRGVLERGPDVGTRIVCGEPLLPTAIVATCEVSPEEERRDGHKEEGRAGRECQIWGTWTHRSKGEKQKASRGLTALDFTHRAGRSPRGPPPPPYRSSEPQGGGARSPSACHIGAKALSDARRRLRYVLCEAAGVLNQACSVGVPSCSRAAHNEARRLTG